MQTAQSHADYLASVDLFSTLTRADIEHLAECAQPRLLAFGDSVCRAGEPADGLFVIKSGSVRVFVEEGGKEVSIGVRKAGDVLAEIVMLRESRHEASARASAKTELLFIPRGAIAPIVAGNPATRAFVASRVAIGSAGGLISQLFDLRGKIDKSELDELVRSVGVKQVGAGKVIVPQGSREDRRLYVVRHGEARIVRNEDGTDYTLATLRDGDTFGEKACLMRQEHDASVIADTDTALLVIPEKTAHVILARNPKLREALQERVRLVERELQRQKKVAEQRNRPLMLDLKSRPELGEKVIQRFPMVEQAEEMDCGAACLAMICKYYGIGMTLGKLRELANVTTQGATLESLARVGESLGFATRGVQCSFDALRDFELPLIVHWQGYHYVIVYGVSKQHVWMADPASGFRKLTVEEFERGWSGTCLVFTPGQQDMAQAAAGSSPWVRFAKYLVPHRKILLHLFLATFVIQMLGLVPPMIIQNILDGVVVHQNVNLLHLLIAGLVISHLFTQIMATIRASLANFMVRKLDFNMMSQFFKHTLSLPYSFFAKRKTGDIFARFQENQTIRAFLTESTVTTVLNLLMIFIYFSVMFLYNVKLTLLLIAFVVPILALTVLVTPRVKRFAREVFGVSTDAKAFLMEALGGVETVKGMGIERPVRLKWEKKYAKALEVQYRAQSFNIFVGFAGQLLNASTTVGILWVGADLVLARELTVGQLIAFNAMMGSVLAPLMGLVGLWSLLNDAAVAMERLGDVLDIEPEQKPEDVASRVAIPDLQADIRMDGVYFRYGEGDSYVLKNINLEIKPGELVAIVGRSGSGKTTLAKMLVGFYKPTDGKISVDGYDMASVDQEYYRRQVGYVMQSNLLFSGTIAENIASGDESPDRRRIEEVAKRADAHAFISKMPKGYEQLVGERGTGLSGGQIQRLCIARALYRDPSLLVFDEATSALDTQSESNIIANMADILKGRTAVIIAHRLSTIMRADKIVVLYEGEIVEQGRHEELVERRGMYYELVQKQLSAA
ncbi:MAG TPA: peptidase domain-containing ABC transporter [Burkholderiaceae bacterium]|nr:peptidase domain-containing ABC transporter [Burkholderiaceae bacterium]